MKEVKRILKTEKKKDILYPMYIDTHTHLHHRRFDKDRKLVLEQMEAVGIQAFLEVAMDLESNAIMREKLREAPMKVRFTAGVHPGARTEKLPLVLHIRDAHEDALQILRGHGSEHRGVVHCFRAVVRKLPLERILLETDSPYVTPKPKKGRNTPVNIPEIARCLARLRRVPAEEIAMVTTENAKRLFGM